MRNMNVTGPTTGSPEWAGDFRGREHLIPGGAKVDAYSFLAALAVTVAVAAAAAGAVSIVPDAPLTGVIPSGTRLNFGAGKFAVTTATVGIGATAIPVEPIPLALDGTESATFTPQGAVGIPSGTVVGRTIAERDAKTPFGPADAADDEIFLVAFDVSDALRVNDIELYRPNSIVKENYLPEVLAGTLDAGVLAEVRARYICTTGEG